MGKWLLLAVMVLFLGAAGWLAVEGWMLHGDVQMPASAYVAMALGIGFSIVVGVGLMALVFYSHRKGYDDAAAQDTRLPHD